MFSTLNVIKDKSKKFLIIKLKLNLNFIRKIIHKLIKLSNNKE
jgi:LEA14-like dessication related protein